MKGYRTLVSNAVSLLAAVLLQFAIELSPEDQAALTGGILVVVNVANIWLRLNTDGPVPFKAQL